MASEQARSHSQDLQAEDASYTDLPRQHNPHIHSSSNQSMKDLDRSSSPESIHDKDPHISTAEPDEQPTWTFVDSSAFDLDPPSTQPSYPSVADEVPHLTGTSRFDLKSHKFEPSSVHLQRGPSPHLSRPGSSHSLPNRPTTQHPTDSPSETQLDCASPAKDLKANCYAHRSLSDHPHSNLDHLDEKEHPSTQDSFSTATHQVNLTDHRSNLLPPISEQFQACATPHHPDSDSVDVPGTQPIPAPYYTQLERINSDHQSRDLNVEDSSTTFHHSISPGAAAEAGRAFRANQAKRERSLSASLSEHSLSRESTEEMTGPADPGWVKERLEWHNMVQDYGDHLKRFPKLKSAVEKIISRSRKSEASKEEFEKFKGKLEVYENQNEDTLLAMGGLTDEALYESVGFFESGIIIIVNREYQRGYVPFRDGIHQIDPELVAKMTKLKDQGMTNPKPDRTFGIHRDKCKFPEGFQMPQEVRDLLEIMQDLNLPFLIIEGKSQAGSSGEARNQACRGGAAPVHCHRLLKELLGYQDEIGADGATFVFSATYVDGLLDVWVHWAEVRKGENALPLYHMSLVASKSLKDEAQLRQARIVLHNILDWGCKQRLDELKPLYQQIAIYSGFPVNEGEGTEGGEKKSPSKKTKTQSYLGEPPECSFLSSIT
ncbi:MAG: hypothetical protein Q9170_008059 [Blastenia crenularia]